eukprot:1949626-Pyramimonas_sp.AAC.1
MTKSHPGGPLEAPSEPQSNSAQLRDRERSHGRPKQAGRMSKKPGVQKYAETTGLNAQFKHLPERPSA